MTGDNLTFVIWHYGDRTVGDYGDEARVTITHPQDKQREEEIVEVLRNSFALVWDQRKVYIQREEDFLAAQENEDA